MGISQLLCSEGIWSGSDIASPGPQVPPDPQAVGTGSKQSRDHPSCLGSVSVLGLYLVQPQPVWDSGDWDT